MLNYIFNFNSIQKKINLFSTILRKYKINPDTVMVYGTSIGSKMRWDSQLDFLVETENGQELSSWEFEDCNDELLQLFNVKCSIMTNEHLLQSEKNDKINKGIYESITKEKLPLKELLQNLEIINAMKNNDKNFTMDYLKNKMNMEINQLLVTDLGFLPILNYAILVDAHQVVDDLLQFNNLNPDVKGSDSLNAPQCCLKKIFNEHVGSKNIESIKLDYLINLILKFSKYLTVEDIETLNRTKNEWLKNAYQQIKEKKEFESNIANKESCNVITVQEILSKSNFEDELKELLKKHGVRIENTKDLELTLLQLAEQVKMKSESKVLYVPKSY